MAYALFRSFVDGLTLAACGCAWLAFGVFSGICSPAAVVAQQPVPSGLAAAEPEAARASVEQIDVPPLPQDSRELRPITQVTVDVSLPAGPLPAQSSPPDSELARVVDSRIWGGWNASQFQWSATQLCHRPLYFEQVNVERYGYTINPCLQPAISGAHFFLTIPALPYKMTAQPPRECIYTLGHYRPGSRAPRRWHHMEWDPTAATVEGAVATGLVFLIP